jgi:hypothetical protein
MLSDCAGGSRSRKSSSLPLPPIRRLKAPQGRSSVRRQGNIIAIANSVTGANYARRNSGLLYGLFPYFGKRFNGIPGVKTYGFRPFHEFRLRPASGPSRHRKRSPAGVSGAWRDQPGVGLPPCVFQSGNHARLYVGANRRCEPFTDAKRTLCVQKKCVVFPKDPGPEVDQRIPKRGLREIMRFGHIPLLRRLAGDRKIDTDTVERVFAAEESLDGGPSQIARWQQRREQLHEQWVKEKQLDETGLREYCEILSRISRHRQDSNFVNLVDHVRAHRLVMAVLGRLVDYAGLFERDLYFTTLALLYRKGLRPEHLLEERGLRFLFRGQIIFALREHKGSPQALDILDELAKHFTRVWATGNSNAGIRNSLAHLNMLQGASPAPRLSHWVNQTRQLLAHDRKLKNAVSKSVIELLAREGMELRWTMKIDGTAHELAEGGLSARCARHLGGKRLILANTGPRPATVFVDESLHSDGYVAMIATAFEGRRQQAISIEQNLPRIDWKASAESKGVRQGSSDARPKRPSLLEKQGSAPRRPADPATSLQRRPRD